MGCEESISIVERMGVGGTDVCNNKYLPHIYLFNCDSFISKNNSVLSSRIKIFEMEKYIE